MTGTVKAWSYSRLAQWEGCPAAFNYKSGITVPKVKEEQSPAMARGDEIHKMAARFITTPDAAFPAELAKFDELMWQLHDIPAESKTSEQQWGFTKNWRSTGWFSADTWFRNVLDAAVVYPDGEADVIDFKTGKMYDSNEDQRELNALALICRFPQVSKVTSRMWYLDSGHETYTEIEAWQRSELIEKWEKRVAPMFADTVFAPRPNDKCRWCSFAKSKKGPCKFG